MLITTFSPFPKIVCPFRNKFCRLVKMLTGITKQVDCIHSGSFCTFKEVSDLIRLKKTPFSVHLRFNPFPNKTWFLRVCSTSL